MDKIKSGTVYDRIRRGWDPERARTEPVKRPFTVVGDFKKCGLCLRFKHKSCFAMCPGHSLGVAARCKSCRISYTAKRYSDLKARALALYSPGEIKCAICPEKRTDFLEIDHINGGGTKQKREDPRFSGGGGFYQYIIDNPQSDLRVLCRNCNWITYYDRLRSSRAARIKELIEYELRAEIKFKIPEIAKLFNEKTKGINDIQSI